MDTVIDRRPHEFENGGEYGWRWYPESAWPSEPEPYVAPDHARVPAHVFAGLAKLCGSLPEYMRYVSFLDRKTAEQALAYVLGG